MITDPALTLHRWLSPAYPVGAYAYSHGIEGAVADGWITGATSARDWISDVLGHGAGRNDAILLAAAFHATPGALPGIADLAAALAPSASRRLETVQQGAAFAATTADVHDIDLPAMPYPVALGRAAHLMDLPLELTLRLFLQAFVANLASAAIRLVPLGQTDGQRIQLALQPLCEALAHEALPGDLDSLGSSALLSDIAAMRQEALTTRLFRS
ncbi:urease accessory protein UreF [Pseudooceanicola sediminis]|uniref:Urease accessory protein UreF n=1 Tax=Pseudooceanicola sediminis TaxID=2211117 RepID=A0A399IXR5_9RHOB|nr:urease accessory protein UreF [Puniceibacterium sp. HSS470]RII37750.1 urease accessory protein UreF [Pseudooceanicola sediminis]|tara:strand:+ start:34013 stop:34654 length:642 start_codon:yes stop_codon:yes gene_type:complete